MAFSTARAPEIKTRVTERQGYLPPRGASLKMGLYEIWHALLKTCGSFKKHGMARSERHRDKVRTISTKICLIDRRV